MLQTDNCFVNWGIFLVEVDFSFRSEASLDWKMLHAVFY